MLVLWIFWLLWLLLGNLFNSVALLVKNWVLNQARVGMASRKYAK